MRKRGEGQSQELVERITSKGGTRTTRSSKWARKGQGRKRGGECLGGIDKQTISRETVPP